MTVDRRWRNEVDLDARLNTVADQRCPQCFRQGPMDVYASRVQWACGHYRYLPPLPSMRPQSGRRS